MMGHRLQGLTLGMLAHSRCTQPEHRGCRRDVVARSILRPTAVWNSHQHRILTRRQPLFPLLLACEPGPLFRVRLTDLLPEQHPPGALKLWRAG